MTGQIGRIRLDLARKIPVYPLPDDIQTLPARGMDLNALWLIPENCTGKRLILFIHGGGYIAGSIRTHRELAGRIAQATNARCLLPEYRLAPEHPFPAAIEDCVSVYRWMVGQGIAPHNIVFVGDSAGGGLVAAMLVYLRDNGTPLPSKAVLMAPWVDLTHDGTNGRERLGVMAKAYLNDKDPKNPLASPLYANLHQLPPMMIQVSDGEPLYPQTVEFSKRVQAYGGSVALDVWKGLPHLWQYFSSVSKPGRTAIERIGRFIRKTAPSPALPDTKASSFGGTILPGGSRPAGPDIMA
jgi:epsilon-lactone hydrolase